MKKKILLGIIGFFVILGTLFSPISVWAGNPPDQGKSTISGTQAPADGLTSSTVTIVLRDASGNTLSGNDSVTISSSNASATFNPSSVTLDGSGTIHTQMKSSFVGSVPVTVTDITTSGTQITGYIAFYQPGTAPPTPGACTDPAPGSTAQITSAASSGVHSITLTWTDAANPVSHYLLSYGLSSGNYIYGNPNIGAQGATSYTVGGLASGTKYYFVIRAVNGCTPGNLSNEMSAVAGVSITPTPTSVITTVPTAIVTNQTDKVLRDMPTDTPTPMPTDTPSPTPAPSEGSMAATVVTIGTVLGVLIVVGVGAWIFINYRQKQ